MTSQMTTHFSPTSHPHYFYIYTLEQHLIKRHNPSETIINGEKGVKYFKDVVSSSALWLFSVVDVGFINSVRNFK